VKKTIVAVALVLIFVMALAAPAFAQTMVHVGVVKANGNIWSNKQVGHMCNTGMEQTKSIRGNGELTNDWNIAMVKGKATVVDKNDFVSAAGTAAPLVITSEIRLCTPPKYTYKGWDVVDGVGMTVTAPVDVTGMYRPGGPSTPRSWGALTGTGWTGVDVKDLARAGNWNALTSQTWAASVKADPGMSGKLYQDFEAAYGGYLGLGILGADENLAANQQRGWAWKNYASGVGPVLGTRFVGDYFKMSQTARTSMGKVDRYIDISSPWSGALLYEDSEMTGFVEIVETFNMTNLTAGADVPGKWWTGLFTKR